MLKYCLFVDSSLLDAHSDYVHLDSSVIDTLDDDKVCEHPPKGDVN